MVKTENFEKVEIESVEQLRSWLDDNYGQADGVWLVTYKKSSPSKYVSREEVLDQLLCYGWIDGIRRKLDVNRTMQLITPRKAQHWAATYKARAAKLIEERLMQEPGFRSIEVSKKNGLWSFMDDVDQLIIPPDLEASLKNSSGALEFFQNINPSSKRFVLRWIKLAKTEKTRMNRIEKITLLSAKGEKLPGS